MGIMFFIMEIEYKVKKKKKLLERELSHGVVLRNATIIGVLFPKVVLPHNEF